MIGLLTALVGGFLLLCGTILTIVANYLLAQQKESRERIECLERNERIRDDYILSLRQHIVDGKPPPPPEWPEELTRK
jgi:hypothetical protein